MIGMEGNMNYGAGSYQREELKRPFDQGGISPERSNDWLVN